jgi:hypothetical protein
MSKMTDLTPEQIRRSQEYIQRRTQEVERVVATAATRVKIHPMEEPEYRRKGWKVYTTPGGTRTRPTTNYWAFPPGVATPAGFRPVGETMSPAEAEALKRQVTERRLEEAAQIVRQGADRASFNVAGRMKPLSRDAAVVAKELVAKGIPPGQAIKAVASVAQWKFLWGELGPFAADAAVLTPAPIQIWGRRIRSEF